MKIDELRDIIQLVNHSSFNEVQFEMKEEKIAKILIKKGSYLPTAVMDAEPSVEILPTLSSAAPVSVQQQEDSIISESKMSDIKATEEPHLHKIVSPMVGTFYGAPDPNSPKFVQIGDKVESNMVVCIVEAMKLYNEIEAEVEGQIVEILAENGQLVDFGQTLFLVKPE
ncbi:acetyl-CoA carboxylase biotin carboxyl carrier protein [Bacillus sp. JJ1532]|uniref:acetyl-CoA carboxylase biotin carboxyl carrier protein n=1 Tax=Bacillus sp. JJ1532 TaxID=3122958 RepID=UPI002FFFE5C6